MLLPSMHFAVVAVNMYLSDTQTATETSEWWLLASVLRPVMRQLTSAASVARWWWSVDDCFIIRPPDLCRRPSILLLCFCYPASDLPDRKPSSEVQRLDPKRRV